jgi:hypothetical protein
MALPTDYPHSRAILSLYHCKLFLGQPFGLVSIKKRSREKSAKDHEKYCCSHSSADPRYYFMAVFHHSPFSKLWIASMKFIIYLLFL